MDRFWLLTWTTYGTWLPGDERGFVGRSIDHDGIRHSRNQPGTEFVQAAPQLKNAARSLLVGEPVRLTNTQAEVVLNQLRKTAEYRNWRLTAASVMANHVHLIVGVNGDPDPGTILNDFKSYASRQLNLSWPRPESGTWWTESGSRRKLADEQAIVAARTYVAEQEFPLAVWNEEE